MKTYWNEFIERYESRLIYTSLSKTLQAFWHYCNINENEKSKKICDDIMKGL